MDQDQHTSIDDQQFVTNTFDDITGGTNTDGFFASISGKRGRDSQSGAVTPTMTPLTWTMDQYR